MTSQLPSKLYFRIGEVASLVGGQARVLLFLGREFRRLPPSKSAKGQRVYSRRDVENLLRVRDLLYAEGFTIAGAKKKLQRSGVEPRETEERAPAHGEQLRTQLLELRVEVAAFLAFLEGPGGSS